MALFYGGRRQKQPANPSQTEMLFINKDEPKLGEATLPKGQDVVGSSSQINGKNQNCAHETHETAFEMQSVRNIFGNSDEDDDACSVNARQRMNWLRNL